MAFRVGILGAGRIAFGFDTLEGSSIRTHAKAVIAEPRLKIVGLADVDAALAAREAVRFKLDAEVMSVEALCNAQLDALCIATPDDTHLDFVLRAARDKTRVIFVEKPIGGDRPRRAEALKVVDANSGALVVHHLRRWIPGLAGWIKHAKEGSYGQPLSATVHYTRGMNHNGIHAFDLIDAFLSPEVLSVSEISEPIVDFDESDPTRSLSVALRVRNRTVPLALFGVDGRKQTVFSVEIRFEQARIVVWDDAGIRAALYQPADVGYAGFAPELRLAAAFHDEPPALIAKVWSNIADHLDHGAPLACAGREALAAYDLADAISEKIER